jgi:D-alanyl-D-alanine carboxypeptidase (penicillin-binding protein 5/6)
MGGAFMRRIGLVLVILFLFPVQVYAQDFLTLNSAAAILMEQSTGKVLYTHNERMRMYPASTTKILTALIVVEYLDLDDIITVGPEIRGLPAGYNTPIHAEGETITVRNLLRALIIRSGNETGQVLAYNVIRAREGRNNITFTEAERAFSALMNEKARSLGAMESHFNNSYGFHSENHYTTAYDMALISRAYMEIPVLAQIAAEGTYIGDSLEGRVVDGANVRQYNWTNHNELLLSGPNAYPYATGIKTGFTDAAGYCFVGSATKLGFSLISVAFFSPDPPGRFQDTRVLMDYGFFNYAFRTMQHAGDFLAETVIANPRLGDDNVLTLIAGDSAIALLSLAEAERIEVVLIYDDEYLPGEEDDFETDENEERVYVKAPIEKNAVIGAVQYILDGEVLFEGSMLATTEILERTFDSDMDYYIELIKDTVFTRKGAPYWFGFAGFLFGFIGIAFGISANRKNRDRYPRYRKYR